MYEEDSKGCEIDTKLDIDYRFDRNLKKYGKHICLDFDKIGDTFVSATNLGWVIVWDLRNKGILNAI